MKVLETKRLILSHYSEADVPFIKRLVNEPSFIENIGNRNIKTNDDAKNYIETRFVASYKNNGFGLYKVTLKDGTDIGMCGLVKRDPHEDPDVGFAFIPESWGKGYAAESAQAVLEYAKNNLKLKRILGITIPSNTGSIKTLEKIGLKFIKMDIAKESGDEIRVYEILF